MIEEELFEITTQIGCTVNCIKYCPQEVITKKYGTVNRVLSLYAFKELIATVPKSVPINFSGVCEPFLNQQCCDMMLHAHEKGHKVIAFSTLVGLKPIAARKLVGSVPFQEFTLHLPDADGNSNILPSLNYLQTLGIIITEVKNLTVMRMQEPFVSNNAEKIARGTQEQLISGGAICFRHEIPNLNMLPNGDVYFCCIARGCAEKVGSLYDNTYQELVAMMPEQSLRMQRDPKSICHGCGYAMPGWNYKMMKAKRMLL